MIKTVKTAILGCGANETVITVTKFNNIVEIIVDGVTSNFETVDEAIISIFANMETAESEESLKINSVIFGMLV